MTSQPLCLWCGQFVANAYAVSGRSDSIDLRTASREVLTRVVNVLSRELTSKHERMQRCDLFIEALLELETFHIID